MDKSLQTNQRQEKVSTYDKVSKKDCLPVGKFVRKSSFQNKYKPISSISGKISNQKNMGVVFSTCVEDTTQNCGQSDNVITGHGRGHGQNRSNLEDQSDNSRGGHGSKNVDISNYTIDNIEQGQLESLKAEIDNVIDGVWKNIDRSISDYEKKVEVKKNGGSSKKGWRVIRIFISSTFADFHEEREVIVKKVMPTLREFCEQYRIHLLECDLRWGVPKNTDTEETISICLDEITRCIDETDGQPFFLSLLSERYGWIPTLQCLSKDTIEKYDWIYPVSITHMEIIHAAIRTHSQNAIFMLRDVESLNGLPDKFQNSYIDKSLLARESLQRLKHKLGRKWPDQTRMYKSTITGTSDVTGLEKITFNDLDDFASEIISFFKERITRYLFDNNQIATEDLSEVDKMQHMQDVFIEKRGQLLLGRDNEIKAMMSFVQNQCEEKCLLVIAEPGTGKSSLVANYVMKLNKDGIPCLYNFSSSAPGSTDSIAVMQRFCDALAGKLNEDPPNKEEVNDYESITKYFCRQLKDISLKIPGFTIILDAVNQFSDSWGQDCDWLPVPCDDINVRYIISCTPDYKSFEKMTAKFEDCSQKIQLTGFDIECRKELVKILFSRYNKKLDTAQLEMFTTLEAASSPLWLALACEELRVFGVFEQVTERIKHLPGSISELLGMIFERITSEDETKKVEETFGFLHCAESGLTETELRYLLNEDKNECLPMMTWVQIRRQMKPFLLNTGVGGEEEMYSFFHNAVGEAVSKNFLSSENVQEKFHEHLANYFLKNGEDGYRTSNAILKHLQKAKMGKQLVEFFRKDVRAIRISDVQKSFVLKKLRCIQRIMPGNNPFKSEVRMCNRCSMKSKLVTQKPLQMKQLCMVCGAFAPFQKPDVKGFVCNKHKPSAAPKTDKCYFCKQVLFLEQKIPMYVNCYLCHLCNTGSLCVELTC